MVVCLAIVVQLIPLIARASDLSPNRIIRVIRPAVAMGTNRSPCGLQFGEGPTRAANEWASAVLPLDERRSHYCRVIASLRAAKNAERAWRSSHG